MNKNIHARGIPADLLEHPGRVALLAYVSEHMDHSQYFMSESADGERGILSYSLTLCKGEYGNGIMSYSLFDSIRLIDERARVSRATAKATHDHIQAVYDASAAHLARLEAMSEQWTAQPRQRGQTKYGHGHYRVYIGGGYEVTVSTDTKAETLARVSPMYMVKGLDAYDGTTTAYKYQEHHPDMNLEDVVNRYAGMTTDQLDAIITRQDAEEAERKAERDRAYALEQEAKRAQEAAARAKVDAGGSKYVLLQYVYRDDSDVQSDYFSNTLDHVRVLLETNTPIRTTFAGGRMDIWKLLRSKGIMIPGLKWKHHGGLMALKDSDYTGHGGYNAVVFAEREKVMTDSYTVSALARGMEKATATA
jgi:hypothetical protein